MFEASAEIFVAWTPTILKIQAYCLEETFEKPSQIVSLIHWIELSYQSYGDFFYNNLLDVLNGANLTKECFIIKHKPFMLKRKKI